MNFRMNRAESLAADLRAFEPFDTAEAQNRLAMIDLLARGDAVFSRDHFAPGHVTASCYIIDGARSPRAGLRHRPLHPRRAVDDEGRDDRQHRRGGG